MQSFAEEQSESYRKVTGQAANDKLQEDSVKLANLQLKRIQELLNSGSNLDCGEGYLAFDLALDTPVSMNDTNSSNLSFSAWHSALAPRSDFGHQFTLVFPMGVTVLIATLSIVISLVTVVGNVIVLTSFVIDRQIRQATNYFIASLAVSDLLIGKYKTGFEY